MSGSHCSNKRCRRTDRVTLPKDRRYGVLSRTYKARPQRAELGRGQRKGDCAECVSVDLSTLTVREHSPWPGSTAGLGTRALCLAGSECPCPGPLLDSTSAGQPLVMPLPRGLPPAPHSGCLWVSGKASGPRNGPVPAGPACASLRLGPPCRPRVRTTRPAVRRKPLPCRTPVHLYGRPTVPFAHGFPSVFRNEDLMGLEGSSVCPHSLRPGVLSPVSGRAWASQGSETIPRYRPSRDTDSGCRTRPNGPLRARDADEDGERTRARALGAVSCLPQQQGAPPAPQAVLTGTGKPSCSRRSRGSGKAACQQLR